MLYSPSLPINSLKILIFLLILVDIYLIKAKGVRTKWCCSLLVPVLTLIIYLTSYHEIYYTSAGGHGALFGIIPVKDANLYLDGAKSLLLNGEVGAWNTRRPYATLYLASILKMFNLDLKLTLWFGAGLILFLVSFSSFLLCRIMPLAFAFTFSLFFHEISKRYFISTLSEVPGIILGLISFIFFIRFLSEKNRRMLLYSLLYLTIAMLIRAGAVFVVMFLLLYVIYLYFSPKKPYFKNNWKIAGVLMLFLGIGFMNYIATNSIAKGNKEYSGNFCYILYSLSKGGVGWKSVFNDFPEIYSLGDKERSVFTTKKAIENIKKNPRLFVAGMKHIFIITIKYNRMLFYLDFLKVKWIKHLVLISFVAGVTILWITKQRQTFFLMTAYSIGILVSIPFLEAISRAHAATFAFQVFIPLYMVMVVFRFGIKKSFSIDICYNTNIRFQSRQSWFPIIALYLILILPLFFSLKTPSTMKSQLHCTNSESILSFRVSKRDIFDIPDEKSNQLKKQIEWFFNWTYFDLTNVRQVTNVFNLYDNRNRFLVTKDSTLLKKEGIYTICAQKHHWPGKTHPVYTLTNVMDYSTEE